MLRQAPTLLTLTIDDVRRFQEPSQASSTHSHTDDELCEGEHEVLAWFSEPDSAASHARSEQRNWVAVNKRHLQNSASPESRKRVNVDASDTNAVSQELSAANGAPAFVRGMDQIEATNAVRSTLSVSERVLGVRASASSTSLLNPSHASSSLQATDVSNSTARRSTRAAAGRFRGGGTDAARR
ncbi:hypothetical protein HDU80_007647 [Chytriomyces hyalinus]|nr:hypothetical protein HDU80_007647 [Chytriomyces hyalinus]